MQRHIREYFHKQRQIQRKPIVDREYQQPVRIVQNPISIDPQQQYPPSPPLQEQRTLIQPQPRVIYPHENPKFNLAGFGLSIAVIGAVGGYMYLTSASIKGQIDTIFAMGLGKLSVLAESDAVMGIIILGLMIALVGIMIRRR
jgi:hypothetical protein